MIRRFGTALVAMVLAAGLAVPWSADAASASTDAVIEKRVIGRSVAGRPLVVWHLGVDDARPTVVLFATMDGNEPAPRQILSTLRGGPPIRGVDLWVVPT